MKVKLGTGGTLTILDGGKGMPFESYSSFIYGNDWSILWFSLTYSLGGGGHLGGKMI